jgi:hypothetical protein
LTHTDAEGTNDMSGTWNGWGLAVMLAVWMAGAGEARAQQPRPIAIEGTVGWAGFVDDATIHHTVYGAGARISLTPRISVGPEFAYMVGPDADRDIFVLGSMWIDWLAPAPGRPVAPYCVFGGGLMSHRDELGRGPYPWKHEGSFTAGGGARVRINDRISVGGDVRLGWELHLRTAGHVGVTWPKR